MPIYEYRCQVCQAVTEELAARPTGPVARRRCEKCGGEALPMISMPKPQTWAPLFLEHVCPGGKTFETKQKLKDYCRDNGLASNALL